MPRSWISFILCGVISIFFNKTVFYEENIDLFAVFYVIFISIFVIKDITECFKQESKIILLSYLFRLFLLYWGITYRGTPLQLPNDIDSAHYHSSAVSYLQGSIPIYENYYSKLVAGIYYFFGISRIMSQYLNILFSLTSIYIISLILKKLNLNSIGIKIVALIPNYAIMSTILIRECVIIFMLTCSTYFIVSWLQSSKFTNFLFGCFFCGLAGLFHGGSISPLIAYIIIFLIYNRKNKQINLTAFQKFLLVGFVIGFLIVFAATDNLSFDFMEEAELQKDAHEFEKGGATYIVGIDIANPILNFVVNTPIRVFYYLLSPMPWDWRGANDILCFFLSSLFYTSGIILTIKILRNIDNNNPLKKYLITLLLVMGISSVIFSWGVTNSGTAMRHRDKFIAPYIVMAMCALNQYPKKKIFKIFALK